MALRKIVLQGDDCLKKVCRPVTDFNARLHTLLDDMTETLIDSGGVGLAAPQVGILRRVVLVDIGGEKPEILELINPELVETSGEQTGQEGCLSVPGKSGQVTRPNYVKAVALNENMQPIEVEGTELLARAICHELDHLDGHLYVEKVEGDLQNMEIEEE